VPFPLALRLPRHVVLRSTKLDFSRPYSTFFLLLFYPTYIRALHFFDYWFCPNFAVIHSSFSFALTADIPRPPQCSTLPVISEPSQPRQAAMPSPGLTLASLLLLTVSSLGAPVSDLPTGELPKLYGEATADDFLGTLPPQFAAEVRLAFDHMPPELCATKEDMTELIEMLPIPGAVCIHGLVSNEMDLPENPTDIQLPESVCGEELKLLNACIAALTYAIVTLPAAPHMTPDMGLGRPAVYPWASVKHARRNVTATLGSPFPCIAQSLFDDFPYPIKEGTLDFCFCKVRDIVSESETLKNLSRPKESDPLCNDPDALCGVAGLFTMACLEYVNHHGYEFDHEKRQLAHSELFAIPQLPWMNGINRQ
jgi:hypothetical protein